jgi:hypothetical protein
MADFLMYDEGAKQVLKSGFPATARFLLSTKPCSGTGAHKVTDTLSGTGVGEITGTGYARLNQATPEASGTGEGLRAVSFALMTWLTEAHTDWPTEVKSAVLVTSADNTGKAICAWNLQTGGAARNLSGANTKEEFTPTYEL